jgi:hypothetical protein
MSIHNSDAQMNIQRQTRDITANKAERDLLNLRSACDKALLALNAVKDGQPWRPNDLLLGATAGIAIESASAALLAIDQFAVLYGPE